MLHFKQPITSYVEQPPTQEVGTLSGKNTTARKSHKRQRQKVIQETATASLPPLKKISHNQKSNTLKISIKLPDITANTFHLLSPALHFSKKQEEDASFMKMMREEGQYMAMVLKQSPKFQTGGIQRDAFETPTYLNEVVKNQTKSSSKAGSVSEIRKFQETSVSDDNFVQRVLKEEEDDLSPLKLEPQPISPLPDDQRDITIVDDSLNEFPDSQER